MDTIKSIVCPLDLSESSKRAYRVAKYLSDITGAELWVLHVIPEGTEFYSSIYPNLSALMGGIQEHIEEKIDAVIDTKDPLIHRVVLSGKPYEEIIKFQEHKDADLIVMGAKGISTIEAVLLGNTADRVLRNANCPVIINRGDFKDYKIKKILVPTNLSEFSEYALKQVIGLARKTAAEIDLLHVLDIHTYDAGKVEDFMKSEKGKSLETKARNAMKTPEGSENVTINKVLARGFETASEIVHYAVENNVDLIAIASHGRKGISKLLLGSVADKVIRIAPCPVMVVKHPKLFD
ncbi:putative universal stress protein [bacterium BMS3Bbin03]|nr:putative universal stress protein [bacterium BMS3Bbin03]HDL78503.1 universal stress protein [Bacteroidota bacterium]